MQRIIGLETEYGLWIEGLAPGAMVEESRALVRAYQGRYASPWDYSDEDPRRDMRGFSVPQLTRDPEDARFDATGPRYASLSDEHADRILPNGGRLYNDHGHPEYSTPECLSVVDLVAHDRAGSHIVHQCALRRAAELGKELRVYKNNTDYHGAAYGTHECYLSRRSVPADTLIAALLPFLATRQVFSGAGKAIIEGNGRVQSAYQISQRADFVSVDASVDTLHRRPLFNTRDEPHAPDADFRRLHVISGDANMSDWATAMKVGTLALVLDAIEAGCSAPRALADPVEAVKEISRTRALDTRLRSADGSWTTPIRLQRDYLALAHDAPSDLPERQWVLDEWDRVLRDLETDPMRTSDRVDWVAKLELLTRFAEEDGLDWSSPVMMSLDLAYHDISPEDGLQRALEQEGLMLRIADDDAVQRAAAQAPSDTRAFIRGFLVDRHAEAVRSASWSRIEFFAGDDVMEFDTRPLVNGSLARLNSELAVCTNLDETMAVLSRYRASDRSKE
ncbi:MAG: proteasome accessory factor PafA2 family protein [Chthonomonadales bacterium]|nr:proteasome accessory factor PafA2 family protein [Chthonomonadales bacterium]